MVSNPRLTSRAPAEQTLSSRLVGDGNSTERYLEIFQDDRGCYTMVTPAHNRPNM